MMLSRRSGFGDAASAAEIVTARHNDYTGPEKSTIQDQNHRFKFLEDLYIILAVRTTRFHVVFLTGPDHP